MRLRLPVKQTRTLSWVVSFQLVRTLTCSLGGGGVTCSKTQCTETRGNICFPVRLSAFRVIVRSGYTTVTLKMCRV